MTYKLSPSILAADVACLGEQVHIVEEAGADYVHIDVMDGSFVPNLSFGLPIVAGLRKSGALFFDVHLMIEEPIKYVERFAIAGADGITVHAEACSNLEHTIDAIRDMDKKAGVAISPDTPVWTVLPVLEKVSMILVMTVYPGYGGQQIMRETFQKVKELRRIITERDLDIDIEVDGGVNLDNIDEIMDAGANVFVAGTKIFSGDIAKNIKNFKRKFAEREQ
ncbi:MAG: ribulose-phosphate 3-epimerase [Eubacterium sp.]|nr:ribulose-phosphate 3-epimerase [Eubacterium sp.]